MCSILITIYLEHVMFLDCTAFFKIRDYDSRNASCCKQLLLFQTDDFETLFFV